MGTGHALKKITGRALRAGGLAVAGAALGLGSAHAQPGLVPPAPGPWSEYGPVPPGASGPYKCCPGDEKSGLHPGTGRGCPGTGVSWDAGLCHIWYGVYWGHGNVAPGIWEGPEPPPPEALKKPWCGFPFMCSGTP